MNLSELISAFSRYIHRINDVDVAQCCGLTIGTTTSKLKTANAIIYSILNFHGLEKAATDNITVTACAAQAATSFCYYLVSINSSGTVTVTKGTDNAYSLPSIPLGNIDIGAFRITAVATIFTAGTTAFNASGITTAFYDIDIGIGAFLINQAQTRLERGVTVVRNGRQRTLIDFDHMTVRATEDIVQGDTSVTLPFPQYKSFKDGGLTITDSSGIIYPMEKRDVLPLGTTFQARPSVISRMPPVETVFTPDGFPARVFDIWPESDADYTINTIAYQYSPDLDGVIYTTNWLTENTPDILLFGALVEAAAYFPADDRVTEWKERWNEAVWTLAESQNKEAYSGREIRTRFPDPVGQKTTSGLATSEVGILSYGYTQYRL